MNTHDTYYPDLITRYLSAEASPEEIAELSAWIQSGPENSALFNEFRKTWLDMMADQVEQQVDPEVEWKALAPKLKGFITQGTSSSKASAVKTRQGDPGSGIRDSRSGRKQPANYAPQPTPHTSHPATFNLQPVTENQPLTPEQPEPKIVPISKGRLPLQVIMIRASLVAAIALVLLIPTWIAYRYFTQTAIVRLAAASEVMDAVLPDGSIVSLNAFSSLTYAEDYGKTNRNIELNGQAYFEVNRDSLLPFVINCSNSRLEVLGTSFYVDAQPVTGDLEVVLVDGSVSLYFEESRSLGKRIIPGEKAEMTQSNQRIVVSPNDDPNFLAWKTHHLIFLDDRLDMIVNTLGKVYQADISLANEGLASCRLTAAFDQQSLESVLNVIMATLDLRLENTASGMILYGKGCN